jgi:hypothetical protein
MVRSPRLAETGAVVAAARSATGNCERDTRLVRTLSVSEMWAIRRGKVGDQRNDASSARCINSQDQRGMIGRFTVSQ